MNLNELSKEVHAANRKWWQDPHTGEPIERNPLELLALAVSEVSECLEGERKNLMDDKLPHRRMAEVEMADTYIRLLDFAGGFGHPVCEVGTPSLVPDNKGAALYYLMRYIIKIGDDRPSVWLSISINFIKHYCKKHGYDLQGAFEEKMEYNRSRADHTHESRRSEGGKQF